MRVGRHSGALALYPDQTEVAARRPEGDVAFIQQDYVCPERLGAPGDRATDQATADHDQVGQRGSSIQQTPTIAARQERPLGWPPWSSIPTPPAASSAPAASSSAISAPSRAGSTPPTGAFRLSTWRARCSFWSPSSMPGTCLPLCSNVSGARSAYMG